MTLTRYVYDDIELFRLEIDATYRLSGAQCFPVDQKTRVFIGQTRIGNICVFRADQPEDLVREVEAVLAEEPVVPDLRTGLTYLQTYRRIVGQKVPVKRVAEGFGYRYPESIRRFPGVVRVTRENVELGAETFPWVLDEVDDCQPCVAAVEDGKFVSICHSVRPRTRCLVAGIDTLEGYRRKGHATAVAAEWGAAVREMGLEPIYSTSVDNVASQGVARKAGLILYNADHHFR